MEKYNKIKNCFDRQFPNGYTPDHTPINCPENNGSCRECSLYLNGIDIFQTVLGKTLQQSVSALSCFHNRKTEKMQLKDKKIICDLCGSVLQVNELDSSICVGCLIKLEAGND